MTQKDAIVKVLEKYGGRAKLADVYSDVVELANFKTDSDKKATIRTILQRHPELFRPSEGRRGWWELVSYQEELAIRDLRIKELMEENELLKAVKTEDDFVERFVEETKRFYKHERKKADAIRQIMIKVGRRDAEADIDAWIEGREYNSSVNVQGDFVMNKSVEHEVNNVASGATGISINKEKP